MKSPSPEQELSDRRQRVVLQGGSSELTSIHAGVLQGSVLGHLLFSRLHQRDCCRFADTSLYIIVDVPLAAAGCLNTNFQKITRLTAIWLVKLNPSKTEAFLESRRLRGTIFPSTCKTSK